MSKMFDYIHRLIFPPEEPKPKRLWAITTNGERYVIYTRDHHEEIRSLSNCLKGEWKLEHTGILRSEIPKVFEVERMLNNSGEGETRDEEYRANFEKTLKEGISILEGKK